MIKCSQTSDILFEMRSFEDFAMRRAGGVHSCDKLLVTDFSEAGLINMAQAVEDLTLFHHRNYITANITASKLG